MITGEHDVYCHGALTENLDVISHIDRSIEKLQRIAAQDEYLRDSILEQISGMQTVKTMIALRADALAASLYRKRGANGLCCCGHNKTQHQDSGACNGIDGAHNAVQPDIPETLVFCECLMFNPVSTSDLMI